MSYVVRVFDETFDNHELVNELMPSATWSEAKGEMSVLANEVVTELFTRFGQTVDLVVHPLPEQSRIFTGWVVSYYVEGDETQYTYVTEVTPA